MAKYLAKARYTAPEGVKGLIADGGTSRAEAVNALIGSVGGRVESFYFALGEVDTYTVFDAPDAASAAAASLAVNASGLATVELVALLTPQEVDTATKKIPQFDAPGPTA